MSAELVGAAGSADERAARPIEYRRPRAVRFLMQVVWPAFGAAALTAGLVFSAIDPLALELFGRHLAATREGAYTAGFVLFWLLYVGFCSVTWWLTCNDAQRAVGRMQRAANRPPGAQRTTSPGARSGVTPSGGRA